MSMPASHIHPHPDLAALLEGLAVAPSLPVSGLTDDSRRVCPGDAFVAWGGANVHGLRFAEQSIRAGAAAVIWDATTGNAELAKGEVPFVAVDNLASHLGDIANRFYGTPSEAIDVIGITGTNGKTTVAWLVAQALQLLGRKAGYLGTLGHGIDELDVDLGLTTPPCLDLHAKLAAFRDDDAEAAAIEVSSHALAQGRLDGVRIGVAVFTNLSRDHIDFHGSLEAYAESKARLFTEFDSDWRIIGIDTGFGRTLAERLGPESVVTTVRADREVGDHSYVKLETHTPDDSGATLLVDSSWGRGEVRVPLVGAFNYANALQVLAVLLCRGVDFDVAARTISRLSAPPGRLQFVHLGDDGPLPQVYVDYAHTPAALAAALEALRPHVHGRLWCVFGCGGDRDRGKRPEMGEIAGRLADEVVLTNDNPRSEDPAAIIAGIEAGMAGPRTVIEDRAAAIAWVVSSAGCDDTVLIAGKGHENYQLIGDERLDFSDVQTAGAALHARRQRSRGVLR